ncbi:MAG TPA: DUF2520 domain-containing protein [Acidobacteriota bacterium]|nr:DUF2520 domain-containing protein [Acidobacteriota bacterium]
MELGFIGAGVVGTALALRLSERGYEVVAVADLRSDAAAGLAERIPGCLPYEINQRVADFSDLVFITTGDDAIGAIAAGLHWRAGQSAVHCSGAASLEILQTAREAGAEVGSFHPLQSFAGAEQAMSNLPGSTFTIEAEGELFETLKQMAKALGGRSIKLDPENKPLYHAAAVFAGNYPVTLMNIAVALWEVMGFSKREAQEALLPLMRGALNNLASGDLAESLTGPVARGDLGTIKSHLESLRDKAPEFLHIYCCLGLATVPLALTRGSITETRADEIRLLLETQQRKPK